MCVRESWVVYCRKSRAPVLADKHTGGDKKREKKKKQAAISRAPVLPSMQHFSRGRERERSMDVVLPYTSWVLLSPSFAQCFPIITMPLLRTMIGGSHSYVYHTFAKREVEHFPTSTFCFSEFFCVLADNIQLSIDSWFMPSCTTAIFTNIELCICKC